MSEGQLLWIPVIKMTGEMNERKVQVGVFILHEKIAIEIVFVCLSPTSKRPMHPGTSLYWTKSSSG